MPGMGAACPTQENALCGVSLAQCLSVQQGQGLSSRKECFRRETDPPLPIFYSNTEKSSISSLLLARPLFNPCNRSGSETELPHPAESCTDLQRPAGSRLPGHSPQLHPHKHCLCTLGTLQAGREEFHTPLGSLLAAHHGWLG